MGLDHSFQISKIEIDPHHPDTVIVAAMGSPWHDSEDRGVYRTTDGGVTWQKVLYVGPSVGISDLAMNPKTPRSSLPPPIASAALRGATPTAALKTPSTDPSMAAQPGSASVDTACPRSRSAASASPSLPARPTSSTPSWVPDEGVLWRSADSGDHWSLVSKDQEVDVRPFYFSHIAIDPRDPDHILAFPTT